MRRSSSSASWRRCERAGQHTDRHANKYRRILKSSSNSKSSSLIIPIRAPTSLQSRKMLSTVILTATCYWLAVSSASASATLQLRTLNMLPQTEASITPARTTTTTPNRHRMQSLEGKLFFHNFLWTSVAIRPAYMTWFYSVWSCYFALQSSRWKYVSGSLDPDIGLALSFIVPMSPRRTRLRPFGRFVCVYSLNRKQSWETNQVQSELTSSFLWKNNFVKIADRHESRLRQPLSPLIANQRVMSRAWHPIEMILLVCLTKFSIVSIATAGGPEWFCLVLLATYASSNILSTNLRLPKSIKAERSFWK